VGHPSPIANWTVMFLSKRLFLSKAITNS